jgi:hypothetical protein
MIDMMNTRSRRGTCGRKSLLTLACLLPLAGLPAGAAAQEVELETDARMEGYSEPMALEAGSSAMTWLGFAAVSVIALLGLFKDAKRSHLD